jgi:hypothetical protein
LLQIWERQISGNEKRMTKYGKNYLGHNTIPQLVAQGQNQEEFDKNLNNKQLLQAQTA